MENKFYRLPELPYPYDALTPHISKEQLTIHHDRHHQGYVTGANAILEQLDGARKDGRDLDMKSTLKALSFNILAEFSARGQRRRRTRRRRGRRHREGVWELRSVQTGVLAGRGQRGGLGMGCPQLLPPNRSPDHHADREA